MAAGGFMGVSVGIWGMAWGGDTFYCMFFYGHGMDG